MGPSSSCQSTHVDGPLSIQYCVNMDGHGPHHDSVPSPAKDTATRQRLSSRREALNLALWAVVGAVFVVAYLRVGVDLWSGARGLLIFGGLGLLALLLNIHRARIRTVHPRHFRLVEGAAALWLGVGAGITGQVLGIAEGNEVSVGIALLAALVLSAPVFGCAMWLAVRGR